MYNTYVTMYVCVFKLSMYLHMYMCIIVCTCTIHVVTTLLKMGFFPKKLFFYKIKTFIKSNALYYYYSNHKLLVK